MNWHRITTRLLTLSACIALISMFTGCDGSTYLSGSSSTPPPVPQKSAAALKAVVDDYMANAGPPAGIAGKGIPGAIVAVQMNGYQPWYYACGSAEIDVASNAQKSPMRADMPFRIASVTKMFIAQAVIQLAQQGKIDLNKSVQYYLPGALSDRNAATASTITINMLLNHTSGIYSYVASDASLLNGNGPTPELPINRFVRNLGQGTWPLPTFAPDGSVIQNDILKFANTFNPPSSIRVPLFNNASSVGNPYATNPYFVPGSNYHYSNTNYYLLGLLIEKVTGKPVGAVIDELIVKPLGLSDTFLPTTVTTAATPSMLPQTFTSPYHVHGYTDYFDTGKGAFTNPVEDALFRFSLNVDKTAWGSGDGILEDFTEIDPSYPWTTGGMISSAKDLLTFLKFVMTTRVQTGQEKANGWVEASPLSNTLSFKYGRGIAQVMGTMFGHGGQFAGYNVAVYWNAPLDIYIVVLTNKYSFVESAPNDMLGAISGMSGTLYKAHPATAGPGTDPNTALINGMLDALQPATKMAGSLKRVDSSASRFPDVTGLMR